MYDVRISESLYEQARQAAESQHVSLDHYVEGAIRSQLEADGPLRLTPEQVAAVSRAESDIDAGRFFTAEQVREYFEEKKTTASPRNP